MFVLYCYLPLITNIHLVVVQVIDVLLIVVMMGDVVKEARVVAAPATDHCYRPLLPATVTID